MSYIMEDFYLEKDKFMAIDNGPGVEWERPKERGIDGFPKDGSHLHHWHGTPTIGSLFVAFIVSMCIIVGLFALVKILG